MNDLMLGLIEARDKIKHGGQIVIMPKEYFNDRFAIRVVWFLEEKHSFQMEFSKAEIRLAKFDILAMVIDKANRFIENIDEIKSPLDCEEKKA